MRSPLLLLGLLVGCDRLFLTERLPLDAPPDADCTMVSPDEDGDCIADSEDNCPGIANPEQADVLDKDGVGDACDPNARTVGDRIVAFYGFGDPAASMAAWRDRETGPAGNWRFRAGYVEHIVDIDSFQALQTTAPVDARALAVEVGFEHVSFGPLPTAPNFGLFLDNASDQDHGHHCFVLPSDSPQNPIMLQESDLTIGASSASSIPALAAGTRYVMRIERRTSQAMTSLDEIRCRVVREQDNGVDIPALLRGTEVWPGDRFLVIGGRNTAVKVHWITVYATD